VNPSNSPLHIHRPWLAPLLAFAFATMLVSGGAFNLLENGWLSVGLLLAGTHVMIFAVASLWLQLVTSRTDSAIAYLTQINGFLQEQYQDLPLKVGLIADGESPCYDFWNNCIYMPLSLAAISPEGLKLVVLHEYAHYRLHREDALCHFKSALRYVLLQLLVAVGLIAGTLLLVMTDYPWLSFSFQLSMIGLFLINLQNKPKAPDEDQVEGEADLYAFSAAGLPWTMHRKWTHEILKSTGAETDELAEYICSPHYRARRNAVRKGTAPHVIPCHA
jgi:hypothetical protein